MSTHLAKRRTDVLQRWIRPVALCLCVVFAAAPVLAAGGQDPDVQMGIQAFDHGADKVAWAAFSRAAKKNDTEAFYWLGHMKELGLGGPKDVQAAVGYYEKAAKAGWALAAARLGRLYLEGEGVIQDFAKAKPWLEKAAHDDILDAQYDLGRLYENGWDVEKNLINAYVWYDFAARTGIPEYRAARARVLNALTPDEVATAQKMAEETRSSVRAVTPGGGTR